MVLLFWLSGTLPVLGQQVQVTPDTISVHRKTLVWGSLGLGAAYGTSLYVLSQTWYNQTAKTKFHFFDDRREWQQLDKAGHIWGSFHESRLGVAALRQARVPEKKAIIYGGLLGFILQSPIEWLDGYAPDYGASVSDLGANALGSAAVITQELLWGELRLVPKYSFNQTRFARLRPQVLGNNLPEQALKDYNGQTYWLAADISAFLPATSKFPGWLNLAVGYGGEQMVYGEPAQNKQNGYNAYRQYYLALDFNLTNIKTRHKFLQRAFYVLSIIHLPAPAVEFNQKKGFRFHPFYF